VRRGLGPLNQEASSINIMLSAFLTDTIVLAVHWRTKVKDFLVSEKH
jgi:hypothetical protein